MACVQTFPDESGVTRIVGVRREQRGAARSERAVGIQLNRAHPEAAAVRAVDDSALQVLFEQRGLVPEHRVVA